MMFSQPFAINISLEFNLQTCPTSRGQDVNPSLANDDGQDNELLGEEEEVVLKFDLKISGVIRNPLIVVVEQSQFLNQHLIFTF